MDCFPTVPSSGLAFFCNFCPISVIEVAGSHGFFQAIFISFFCGSFISIASAEFSKEYNLGEAMVFQPVHISLQECGLEAINICLLQDLNICDIVNFPINHAQGTFLL